LCSIELLSIWGILPYFCLKAFQSLCLLSLWDIILSHKGRNRVPCIDGGSFLCKKKWRVTDLKQSMMGMLRCVLRSRNQRIHDQRGIPETSGELEGAATRRATRKWKDSIVVIVATVVNKGSSRCESLLLEGAWVSWSVVVTEVFLILFIIIRSQRYYLLWGLNRVHDIFKHELFGILGGIQMHGGWFSMLGWLNLL